jgi:hypothetical protein
MPELQTEELRQILRRAEELDREAALGGQTQDALIAAAEEAGLTRESVVRALQERMVVRRPFHVGEWVYARSTDRRFYPATVSEVLDWGYHVHFATGGELSVPAEGVRPVELLPGGKVEVPWPGWGWYNAAIVAYDPRTQMLTASDGMSQKQFAFAQTRLRPDLDDRQKQMRVWLTHLLVGVAGTGLGMLIMRLLMR